MTDWKTEYEQKRDEALAAERVYPGTVVWSPGLYWVNAGKLVSTIK